MKEKVPRENEAMNRSRELASYFRLADPTMAEGVSNYFSKFTKDEAPIIVVEPFLPVLQGNVDSFLIRIDKFKHPYRAIQATSPYRVIKDMPPPADDPGHALHVSHIIGGKVKVDGWIGLANDQTIDIMNASNFERFVKRELNQIKENPSPPLGRIYNLSFVWETMPCIPNGSESQNKKLTKRVAGTLKYLANHSNEEITKSLFVVAASTQELTKCPFDEVNKQIADDNDCTNLFCYETLPIVLIVGALDDPMNKVRAETRYAENRRILEASGTRLFSADMDEEGQGFRFRSGSSQAAAIVTSLAARLGSLYSDLSAQQLKQRLIGTASPPNEKELKLSYGRVDAIRAFESDPKNHTVWYGDPRNEVPLPPFCDNKVPKFSGEAEFYGARGRFKTIPAVITDVGESFDSNLNVPRRQIISIHRTSFGGDQLEFRTLYQSIGGNFPTYNFTEPFQIHLESGRNQEKVCEPNGNQSKFPPCLKINKTPIDLRCVGQIVFPAPRDAR